MATYSHDHPHTNTHTHIVILMCSYSVLITYTISPCVTHSYVHVYTYIHRCWAHKSVYNVCIILYHLPCMCICVCILPLFPSFLACSICSSNIAFLSSLCRVWWDISVQSWREEWKSLPTKVANRLQHDNHNSDTALTVCSHNLKYCSALSFTCTHSIVLYWAVYIMYVYTHRSVYCSI